MALPYSTSEEVKNACGGEERFIQLADYDRDNVADVAIVAEVISEADEWINTYARHRYFVPFDVVPKSITDLSKNEAAYILKCRRNTQTEADILKFDVRLKWLEDLRDGKVSPGTEPPPPKSGHVKGRATGRPSSKKVSRLKLQGYG